MQPVTTGIIVLRMFSESNPGESPCKSVSDCMFRTRTEEEDFEWNLLRRRKRDWICVFLFRHRRSICSTFFPFTPTTNFKIRQNDMFTLNVSFVEVHRWSCLHSQCWLGSLYSSACQSLPFSSFIHVLVAFENIDAYSDRTFVGKGPND